MRATTEGAGAATGRFELRGRHLEAAVSLAVGLVGLAIVWYDLAQPKGLYGIGQYDDGVNFGSAARLVSGILPYRDFTFLQPPGITVLMAPIAWLTGHDTREGLALARMATALVAGLNAFLAAWFVRHLGALAAGVAGLALAIYPTAYFADHTLLLEPYLVFGCLLGACAVFSRGDLASPWRIALGGAAFGVGATVKLWAVVPFAVLAIVLLPRLRQAVLPFGGGAAVGFGLVSLPFFIAAPHAFLTDVFGAQLGRNAAPTRLISRMWSIVGLRGFSRATNHNPSGVVPYYIGGILAAVIIAGLVLPLVRRRLGRLEGYVLFSCVAILIALFIPNQFYSHYTYVTGAFIAIALGCAVARLAAPLRSTGQSTARQLVTATLLAAGIGGSIVVVANETAFDTWALSGGIDPGASIATVIPAGACVVTDAASLTIAGNRFVGPPGCPTLVDSSGAWIAVDPDNPPAPHVKHPVKPAGLVADWRQWFDEADYVAFSAPYTFRVPWTPALRAYFAAHYVVVPAHNALIYRHVRPLSSPESVTPASTSR